MWLFCGAFCCSCLAWHSRVLHRCKSSECSTEMPFLGTRADTSTADLLTDTCGSLRSKKQCMKTTLPRHDSRYVVRHDQAWSPGKLAAVCWSLVASAACIILCAHLFPQKDQRLWQDVCNVGNILEGRHCNGKYALTVFNPRVFQEHVVLFFVRLSKHLNILYYAVPACLSKSQQTLLCVLMLAPWAGCFVSCKSCQDKYWFPPKRFQSCTDLQLVRIQHECTCV